MKGHAPETSNCNNHEELKGHAPETSNCNNHEELKGHAPETSNCNNLEELKGHAPETSNRKIPRDEKSWLFKCPTADRAITSKYKYNIKHPKSIRKVNKNKKGAEVFAVL